MNISIVSAKISGIISHYCGMQEEILKENFGLFISAQCCTVLRLGSALHTGMAPSGSSLGVWVLSSKRLGASGGQLAGRSGRLMLLDGAPTRYNNKTSREGGIK